MNPPTEPSEPTEPVEPLDADTVDELLSAELDGEFDAGARDLGLSPAAARARLAATPGTGARREALTTAQAALATPVTPLPADRRDEMLAVAARVPAGTDELARRRRRPLASRVAGIAAAAAAVLLVIGLAVSIASSGSDNGDDSSASGGAAADSAVSSTAAARQEERAAESSTPEQPFAPSAAALNFGAVPDQATLKARVSDALGIPGSATGLERQSEDTAGDASGAAGGVPDECLALQAANFDVAPVPTLRGPVVYEGTDAEVLVFPRGDDSLVLTVATADCRLLVTVFLHP